MRKPPFELGEGETIIASSSAAKIESALQMMPGRVWLTNRRFEFHGSFGLLFGLIGRWFAKRSGASVALDAIAKLERGSIGRNKNVLVLAARDGAEYRFVVDDYDAFVGAMRGGVPS